MLGKTKSSGKRGWSVGLDHLWRCVVSICGGPEEQVGQTSGRTGTDYREGVSPSPFQHCFPVVPYSVRLTNVWGVVSRGLKAAPPTCTDSFRERQRGERTLRGATKHPVISKSQRTTGFPSAVPQKKCSLAGLSQMLSDWSNAYFLFSDADKSAGRGLRLLLNFLLSYLFCVVLSHCLRAIQRL